MGRSLGVDGGGRQVTWRGWRRKAGHLARMEEEGRSLGADGGGRKAGHLAPMEEEGRSLGADG